MLTQPPCWALPACEDDRLRWWVGASYHRGRKASRLTSHQSADMDPVNPHCQRPRVPRHIATSDSLFAPPNHFALFVGFLLMFGVRGRECMTWGRQRCGIFAVLLFSTSADRALIGLRWVKNWLAGFELTISRAHVKCLFVVYFPQFSTALHLSIDHIHVKGI